MNKRAPLIAAVVGAVLAVLIVMFVVMPKRGEVSERQDELAQAEQQETQLQLQLAQLEAAKQEAPETNEELRRIETLIPPTEDQPGMILLLQSAADRAGVDPLTISSAVPTPATEGAYSIVAVTLDTSGSYFALEEFLFNLETLPRAAKVLTVTLAPGAGVVAPTDGTAPTTSVNELTGQFTVEFYTTDTSAGPNSVPGPSDGEGAATEGEV